jgi:hypothetical protein
MWSRGVVRLPRRPSPPMKIVHWFSQVPVVRKAKGRHARLRVAVVADEPTRLCLEAECTVIHVTPANARKAFETERPDVLFVESAWAGWRDAWKYRVAAYPENPERSNAELVRTVALARDRHIPTVFWNREDAVHFDRFIDSARWFDVVLTVDQNCVRRYQEELAESARVGVLPFAVQPAIHAFDGIAATRRGACFVGSYSQHVHAARRARQDALLQAAAATLGLTVHDRNSDRSGTQYRYPQYPGLHVRPKVPHGMTGPIYKAHLVSLNVNTVEDSPTMYSRRLIEILACGGLAATTPALSVEGWFGQYCHVVPDAAEALDLFGRLARNGYDERDRDMMNEGAQYVLRDHTWARRLDTVLEAIGQSAGGSTALARRA